MRILPFPSDITNSIDDMDFDDWFDLIVDWFDLIVNKQELMSIRTGRLQVLTEKDRLTGSNIFEYRSRLLSHSGREVRQNVYYKVAIDEKDLRDQFMVMVHMGS